MTGRVFVIAEAGVNHNGDIDMARRLVDVAAEAGADCVKFQTFRASRLAAASAPKADYQRQTTDSAETQFDMLSRLELSEAMHEALLKHCAQSGIEFLSTPFDEESADYLASLGVKRFKVPSGEVVNLPFLRHLAAYGKPILLSTGMSDLTEVEAAVRCIRSEGNPPLTLLHCVSAYPAQPCDANLRAMGTMAQAFDLPVGWSDHTTGIDVALAAAALGAAVIEKHFTLDRNLPGPDHRASLEPRELTAMVSGIRTIEQALGDGRKQPVPSELPNRAVIRKSVVAARAIPAGAVLTGDCLAILRPGTGLPPGRRDSLIGRTAREAIAAGTPITESLLV